MTRLPKCNKVARRDRTRAGSSNLFDRCETPAYALDPIIQYLKPHSMIWEPAAGSGRLVRSFIQRGFRVYQSDILTGMDFLKVESAHGTADYIITNPPYSQKVKWLRKCRGLGVPFALLLPVEVLGAGGAQNVIADGMEIIFTNRRINFFMPIKGDKGRAWFPTAWFTWGLGVGRQISFAYIEYRDDAQGFLFQSTRGGS